MRATLRFCLQAGSCTILVLAFAGQLSAAEIHYAAHPVHGSWVVEVEAGAPLANFAHAIAAAHGGNVGSIYERGFRGFVLRVPDQAIPGLAHHPLIKHLIQDEWYSEGVLSEAAPYCYAQDGPQHMPNTRALPSVNSGAVQTVDCTEPEEGSGGPTCIDNWGIDRTGEESLPLDFRFQWPENGVGRRIYHFDTGIRETHREFERLLGLSRVEHLFNPTGDPDGDLHGHGTHVAAIAAGRTYGVAKWATIYRLQIVRGDEMTFLTWIMDGFQAIDDHLQKNPTAGIAVMNWSGGNREDWATGDEKQYVLLRQSLADLLEAHPNLLLVQAAGNRAGTQGHQACDYSFGDDEEFPTVFDQILVAGGSEPSDQRLIGPPWTSNYGECIDLFAPAAVVVSAWKAHDSAACQISGTSMAAPHVSGAAVVFSELFPSADAAGIRDLIVAAATEDALDPSTLGEGSPNLLLALPAADGVIFDDDFAGLVNWPINVETGQGENSACPGGYCAHIESAAADTAYLGDTRPAREYVYRAAFLLSKEDLTFGPGSEVTLFRALGIGDSTLFELLLDTGPDPFGQQNPALRVIVQTNSGPVEGLVDLPEAGPLVDPTLQLEFEFVPSAFESEPEGFFRLWSGFASLGTVQLQINLDELETYGMTVESALLGIVSASGTVAGELWFSDFKSRREDLAISF